MVESILSETLQAYAFFVQIIYLISTIPLNFISSHARYVPAVPLFCLF